MLSVRSGIASAVLLSTSLVAPAVAQAPADFYKGKQIFWILSAGEGGGYSSYARAFAPLLAGMALMRFFPDFSTKVQRALNVLGNAVLTICLLALLWKLGPVLMQADPWLPVAALILALGCLAVSRALLSNRTPGVQTLVISNVNRHVGLALLLSGQYMKNKGALPAIACYALAAPLVMAVYARFARRKERLANHAEG